MKDIQGIQRGTCNKCECEEYRWCPPTEGSPSEGTRLRCEYCNHTPVEHVRIIPLGGCNQCGEDCTQYESEEPNKYTDCQYCGCGAQCHQGAEKLIKKSASQIGDSTGITVRTDSAGNPAQTSQFGECKFPGCNFPKRYENGQLHDYCSRTCASKHEQMPPLNPPGWSQAVSEGTIQIVSPAGMNFSVGATSAAGAAIRKCKICTNPANRGYEWCQRCYNMRQAQLPRNPKQ